LSSEDCQALRDEAVMYYHRYLSLFVLEEFSGVERDTQRNLDVLNLCKQYATEEDDRASLEQYRCYLIMMNTRAKAHQVREQGAAKTALAYVEGGWREIQEYLEAQEMEEAISDMDEAAILEALRLDIAQRIPTDPLEALEQRLATAVSEERYEEAAEIRDRLSEMRRRQRTKKPGKAPGPRQPRRKSP